MTRDYAKNKRSTFQSTTTANRKSSVQGAYSSFFPPWAWLFLGIGLGVFLSGLVYWKFLSPPQPQFINSYPTQNANAELNKSSKPEPLQNQSQKNTSAKARFDFYTLLPNMQVDVPSSLQSKNQSKEASPPQEQTLNTKQSKASTQYIIQVASFRAYTQAESLKASLALKGFESHIQAIQMQNQKTWYRVYLGPFEDKIAAQSTQSKLESKQKMNSFVLKINV